MMCIQTPGAILMVTSIALRLAFSFIQFSVFIDSLGQAPIGLVCPDPSHSLENELNDS